MNDRKHGTWWTMWRVHQNLKFSASISLRVPVQGATREKYLHQIIALALSLMDGEYEEIQTR